MSYVLFGEKCRIDTFYVIIRILSDIAKRAQSYKVKLNQKKGGSRGGGLSKNRRMSQKNLLLLSNFSFFARQLKGNFLRSELTTSEKMMSPKN